VAVTGAVLVFTAINAGIFPVPAAARPIDALLLVQLYTVPATAPLIVTAVLVAPAHRV
jgi:hypothetical protein